MPKIRTISILNFRSIRRLDLNATDLTILVGDNDCGKSNVLRALNLFFNGETNPGVPFNFADDFNRFVQPPARKAREIVVELTLELPENYQRTNGQFIRWRKVWRQDGLLNDRDYEGIRIIQGQRGRDRQEAVEIPARSNVHALLRRIEYEYVPAIRSAEFFRNLRGRIYGVIAEVAEGGFRDTSEDFEAAIAENVNALLNDISEELSDNAQLKLPNDLSGIFERLDFLKDEGSISLDNRGDGIKGRYIPLILKFIAEKKKELQGRGASPHTFIWAYEEPENNLEFRRAQELAKTFLRFAEDALTQIILTTHSPIFYNLRDEGNTLCSSYHARHDGTDSGTVVAGPGVEDLSLDERMGAMAIIAPHVKAAQEALKTALEQAADLKIKIAAANAENRPALFVEGPTEYRLYRALLDRIRPQHAPNVFLAEPPNRAGAHYVANMLRAWEYRVKHLALADRTRAFGIVDLDNAGSQANISFAKEMNGARYVRLVQLSCPAHLQPAHQAGLIVPITLEELWPPNVWTDAANNGFLAPRNKKGLLSEALTNQLSDQNFQLANLIDPAWQIYYDNCADEAQKMAWLNILLNLPDPDLELAAAEHLAQLDAAIQYLTN